MAPVHKYRGHMFNALPSSDYRHIDIITRHRDSGNDAAFDQYMQECFHNGRIKRGRFIGAPLISNCCN